MMCVLLQQGKLTHCHQNGKFTIKYDDGQSEQLVLEKETFQWYMPRARSAGYRPSLHALVASLGAKGIAAATVPEPEQRPQVGRG